MKISKAKRDKIKENILLFLYKSSPKLLFTVEIAQELARDEEFIKSLLLELESKNLVIGVRKNNEGVSYTQRIRWRLSTKVYQAYDSLNKSLEEKQSVLF